MGRDHSEINPDYIPGSEYIFASSYENSELVQTDGDIVLIPQPTISPNDPLNWPKWRRIMQLTIVSFLRGVTTAIADDSFSILGGLKADYPEFSTSSFTTATGILFAGSGGWALFNAPSAYIYGCRISYIIGTIFGIIGNALFAKVKTPGMLYASQFFTGAATSVSESVASLSFAQLCFQHQINDVVGLYVLGTSVGTFAGPLIDGYVAQNLGWNWVGYLGVIFEVVTLFLVIFGIEETYFDRTHYATKTDNLVIDSISITSYPDNDTSSAENLKKSSSKPKVEDISEDDAKPAVMAPQRSAIEGFQIREPCRTTPDKAKTYWQRLQLITPAANMRGWGFKQYAKRSVSLCRVFAFPPVVYSGLQWATQIGWLSVYKSIENDAYILPPYNYGSGGSALMMMPNLIGATIGAVYSTWGADHFVRYMARRNNGSHEAETRLWSMIPAIILYPLGLILFGVGTQYKWSWPPIYVASGFVGFSFGCAGEISISYMADCYPEMVLEGMVGLVFIYTMCSLVISFVAQYWIKMGNLNTMIVCGVVGFFIISSTFPMIFFGKRMRKMTRGMYFRFVYMRNSLDTD